MKFDDAFEIVMNSARLPGTELLSIEEDGRSISMSSLDADKSI